MSSIANNWLKENNLSWSDKKKSKKTMIGRGYKRVPPMMYCGLDVLAFDDLRANEQSGIRSGRMRYKAPKTAAHGLSGVDFLRAHLGYSEPQCLLMPGAKFPNPLTVTNMGRQYPAARLMCKMVHGDPDSPDMVARHLCGRGHLSCVNPLHLRWGTQEQNVRDTSLHHCKPLAFPEVPRDLADAIVSDDRHYNILAIEHDMPSAVILALKSGVNLSGFVPPNHAQHIA